MTIRILVFLYFIPITVYALIVITDIYENLNYDEIYVVNFRTERYENSDSYSLEQSFPYDTPYTEFEDYYNHNTQEYIDNEHHEDYYRLPSQSEQYDPHLYLSY
jgi:hypothetical protein